MKTYLLEFSYSSLNSLNKRFKDILDFERKQDENIIILKESIKEKFMNA